MRRLSFPAERIDPYHRDFFGSPEILTRIGPGAIGGKATGLAFSREVLGRSFGGDPAPEIEVRIPRMVVIASEMFDRFLQRNRLLEAALAELPDDRIAHLFQKAELPAELVGDLQTLVAAAHTPLAVRSSSLLEDAMYEPFAGVYATKMIPNNQPGVDIRFRRLAEALKFLYASTFFQGARDYIRITGRQPAEEKMAVIIQEVIGLRHGDRFYPHLAGVARSHNYYPLGHARPEEGVVNLALGLGKTIVEGGVTWSYSPAWPRVGPPVGSAAELLKMTQTEFWAVNMGRPPEYDPIHETEYLIRCPLGDAEADGTLEPLASTYRPADDRVVPGISSPGPRVVNFAPLLEMNTLPLNDLLRRLLALFEEAVGGEVEIEFAMTIPPRREGPARFGFLQVRPMVVPRGRVEVDPREMDGEGVLAASERVMGNGMIDTLTDVVYVLPETFEAARTPRIAVELAAVNRRLVEAGRPYLLIGFGRWGSSDPWLGIPVEWGQISGARVIVEATLPGMDVELSQGSHFFHNLTSFQVLYFSVHHAGPWRIDWDWLAGQEEASRSEHVRHVRLPRPLLVKIDGRTGRGVIRR